MKNYLFDGHKLVYHIDRVNEFLVTGDCFPLYMEISPTGTCNHRCLFCAYDYIGHPNRRLETGRMLEFIDEIASCGIKSLLYAGEGEPLIHPDIDKFITNSRKKGIDVGLYTNGQLLKEDISEKILPSLTFIRFSFNGGTEENYAEVHNVKPEIFNMVVRNMRSAGKIKERDKLNMDIGVQYVLIHENMHYLNNALRVLKEIGIDYVAVKPFVHQNPMQSYSINEQLNPDDLSKIFDEAEGFSDDNFKVIVRRESFKNYGIRGYGHCLGTSMVSVLNSAGDIASCLPYWDKEEFVFGNIYESSFKEVWLGDRRNKIKCYLESKLDAQCCPPNCRPHAINEFLWGIKKPTVRHINFV